ncbi:hypothetical protein V865_002425 [Kwoniella europaea PYCC6329]|uniref:Large ribosomal subunit protein uL6 alpha-beta domain-containing protein n=1 Tax=Kwoniella europaea PYCC6329 TaxID=1423913 RepID=A0AAX4KD05_9TREE
MSVNNSISIARRQLHSCAVRNSHIGKVPIAVPPSVTLSIPPTSNLSNVSSSSTSAQRVFSVTGPLGSASIPISPSVVLTPPSSSSPSITVSVRDPTVKTQRSIWGLTRTLINNAVTGVSTGFNLEVRLVGVGYRAAIEPIPPVFLELAKQRNPQFADSLPRERLNIKLGFAHPVLIDIPSDIKATVPAPTKIVLSGTDKQKLGQFAATIRQWRKPEPYRGKGIFVGDETIKLKEIKKK